MRAAPPPRTGVENFRPPLMSLAYCGAWSFATKELYYLGQQGWEWGTLGAFVTGGIAISQLAKAGNDWFKVRAHRRKVKRFRAGQKEHGQSRWATPEDVENSEVYSRNQGIFVGAQQTGKRSFRDVFYDGDFSVSLVAPAGEIKTMSIVVPTCLANPGQSLILNDPTGELLSICGPALRKAGYEVVVITPFAGRVSALIGQDVIDVGLDIFSSLKHLKDRYAIRSELQKIAKWVMPGRPNLDEKSEFFYRSARMLFVFLAMKEIVEGRRPALPAIRYHLMKGLSYLYEVFAEAEGSTAFGGVYEELARSLSGVLAAAPQQFAGGYSLVEQHLDPFDPASSIGLHATGSDWNPRTLKDPAKRVAVFVVYTLEMMETYASALAMTLSYLFDTVAADSQTGRVTAILDEAASVRMPLADKLDFYRKTGLRILMCWHDMAQAEFNHGKTGMRRIMGASKLKIGMGLQSPEMLEMFSKLCGTKSITRLQLNDRAMLTSAMPDLSPSLNHESVPLMRPEEVRLMSGDEMLVVGDRLHPLRLLKVPYWTREEWRAIAGPSPYYRG